MSTWLESAAWDQGQVDIATEWNRAHTTWNRDSISLFTGEWFGNDPHVQGQTC